MFSQRPYNVKNFVLIGSFSNTFTDGIAGYPVAVGVVGLAEDASNCIVARYDKVSNKAQLVKIRAGLETTLAEDTPGFDVGERQTVQFKHKDGHFEVYIFDEAYVTYKLVLSYDWAASAGFMTTSSVSTMKTGIYGMVSAPICRILSYSKTGTETTGGDGIPVDPLSDLEDFPSSGRLRIGDNAYTYSAKIDHPTIPRGPFQLRSVGRWAPPYGNGHAGMEILDLDWYGDPDNSTGKLIAVDQGDSFISIGDLWRVFTSTGGSRVYLTNRSRKYSNNNAISNNGRFSSTNRVWIVGGFSGISLYSGDGGRHSVGEWAILDLTGEIKCHWFMGAGGESDVTVEDLVDRVCKLSGAKANFPGDFVDDSLAVSGETAIFQDDYAEGFDLSFETATPVDFEIRANVKVKPDNLEEKDYIEDDTSLVFRVTYNGSGSFSLKLISMPSSWTEFEQNYTTGTGRQKYRVLFYGNNVSLYQNHRWVATVAFDGLIYTQTNYVDIKAYSASSINLENVRVKDLGDWREAVYIDLKTDGNAAIGSIVQERPIEMVSQADGSMSFYYEYPRSTVTAEIPPLTHEFFYQDPVEAGSDAIIYGAGDVQTIQYRAFAKTKGLATRLIRIPNLDVGALEAAQRMLDRLYESRENHMLTMRPNLEVQVADKLEFSYAVPDMDSYTKTIIVEGISLAMQMTKTKSVKMAIRGRGLLP